MNRLIYGEIDSARQVVKLVRSINETWRILVHRNELLHTYGGPCELAVVEIHLGWEEQV